MAFRIVALVAVALIPFAAAADEHPIAKVIDMLKDLKEKAIAEKQDEEVDYGKFKYWCSTSIATLSKAIEEEKATIEILKNKIEGLEKEEKALEGKIKKLEEEIKELEAAQLKADKADEARTKAYTEKKKDIEDTITSIGDAIKAIQGAKSDTELVQAKKSVQEALAFLSMKANEHQRSILVNFASEEPKERPELKAKGDLKSHEKKYEFKSNNVIDLLKELKLKFQDDLTAADVEETNGANQYALEKQARDEATSAAKKSKEAKEKQLADVQESLADSKKQLKDTEADLEADEATLKDTDESCKTKTQEFEERSKTRADEIKAIEEGIKILSEVSGVRHETPKNPVLPQPVEGVESFLQIVDPKQKAVNLLRRTAKTLHSKALERLALEVSTHLTGPFDKVNDMIQKMIFRLMAEQTDEDKHKAWCDMETEKTADSIVEHKAKKEELNAEIEAAKADVALLTDEIANAEEMIANIQKFMDEATEIRQAGKHENEVAIKDAKKAQTALANAVAVLEEFYKKSGEMPKEPWEFIQKKAPVTLPEDPALWDSPAYTGQPGGTNIIAILEETASDYSKMEAETKAQEAEDQKEYDDTMKTHKVEKERRQAEVAAKAEEKKQKIIKVSDLQKSLKHTQDELDAVEKYEQDLQQPCVEGDSTYEDRKAARAKELEALKSAQKTLKEAFKDDKPASFLQIRKRA